MSNNSILLYTKTSVLKDIETILFLAFLSNIATTIKIILSRKRIVTVLNRENKYQKFSSLRNQIQIY